MSSSKKTGTTEKIASDVSEVIPTPPDKPIKKVAKAKSIEVEQVLTEEDKAIADTYRKMNEKQHILEIPDTYIGSIQLFNTDMWVFDDDSDRIIDKNIGFLPGLFKLFDEGVVNCSDHVVRLKEYIKIGKPNIIPVSYIDISIETDGSIIMTNDGNGIDIIKHPEFHIYIPELIFGNLRSSTNYSKEEKRITGGKNGFGVKLIYIWSTHGYIETVDHVRGLKYYQEFKSNLDIIGEPIITKVSTKTKPYTRICFHPDYKRLGVDGLSADMISLFKKRVYDISAVTDKSIKVKYNNVAIPTKNFQQYIDMYVGDKNETPRAYEEANERWEYAVCLSPTNEFTHVSLVNGINTYKGGKHVTYVLNQIIKKSVALIEKRTKKKVSDNSIKEQLMLFLRCNIENPSFDSQTKENMTSNISDFGSTCVVSDKFIVNLLKLGIMERACAITDIKEIKAVNKSAGGKKVKSIRGIPKLEDANFAGGERSFECTLILTEGDSAKAGALSGLSSKDKDFYGVYPLKGKIMNTQDKNVTKVYDNKEISEITKILGLEVGKEYKTMEDVKKWLRYGRIAFFTDSDLDGSHIKALGVNLFKNEWPSLYELDSFINYMNTPILKARKGKEECPFYNEGEYKKWKENDAKGLDLKGWDIKYYKGLGSSTKSEFIEYFKEKKFIGFKHTNESDNYIDMMFNKKRADDRKVFLETIYDKNTYIDTNKMLISYEEFVTKELGHFSKYDCDRNIPNLIDGLKISLRKILYGAFKKKLNSELKVAQFSGYVSEHSGYHHGESSLVGTIVGMAQNFVGSNNINLLSPNGQFGTRMVGGKDAASGRYIFTMLEKITRFIFPEQDDKILFYLNDDGVLVEPRFYVPIIPMVLINPSAGVGTGFSSKILSYNMKDVIMYLKNKLTDITSINIDFIPYYEGFKGTITKINSTKFLFKGIYEKIGVDTIKVTELPVGFWTQDFTDLLEDLMSDKNEKGEKITPIIKDITKNNTDININVTIIFSKGKLEELESIKLKEPIGCNGVDKILKLYSTNTTTNMHLFDHQDKLKKYETIPEIIDAFFDVRLDYYNKRKEYMIALLEKELILLFNKVRYIQENLDNTIDLREKKNSEIINMLIKKNYATIIDDDGEEDTTFKYLIKMPMDSVSKENVIKLNNQHKNKENELNILKNTTVKQMWLSDLEALEVEYDKYKINRELLQMESENKETKPATKKASKKATK